MALFDKMGSKMSDMTNKVSDLAKNLGDMAGDALEVTKLNVKIASEREAAANKIKELGTYYYNKHVAGETLEQAVEDLCVGIDEHYRTIAEYRAEIERVKTEEEDGVVAEAQGEEVSSTSAGKTCIACGTQNGPDANFCAACGAKLP